MNKEHTQAQLRDAIKAIRAAVEMLLPHTELFDRYARERQLMDSLGPIVDPTLWKSRERRDADAIVGPTFDAARQFLRAIETQTLRASEAAMQRADRSNV